MSNRLAAMHRASGIVWITVVTLLLASLLPALTTRDAHAAQILDRYVDMGSSAVSVENNYVVSFQLPNGVTVGAFRIEFCDSDPIPGESCAGFTEGTNVPSLDADTGSGLTIGDFAISDAPADFVEQGGINCDEAGLTLDTAYGAGSNINYVDFHCDATDTTSVTETGPGTTTDLEYVNVQLNNINNPSSVGTFYVRLYTANTAAAPSSSIGAYVAAAPPLDTTGGYEGGVAVSTANTIDVTARVQEQLTFRVGADNTGTACDTFTDTTVDLGVLDSTNVNRTSTDPSGDLDTACVEVTTNASNGVIVYYLGDNLKVGAAACGVTDVENGSPDTTDQCINRDADGSDADLNTFSSQDYIVGGTEQWGLGVMSDGETQSHNNAASNPTANFGEVTNGPYDADTGVDATDNFTFVPNVATAICDSTTVANAEVCQIEMAATAAITTPTGVYTTTLTFIATATF